MPRQVSATQKGWVVTNPRGVMLPFTVSLWRSHSIEKLTRNYSEPRDKWQHWRKQGYDCVKVTMIREDKPKAKQS